MRSLFGVLFPTLLCLIGGCASKFAEPTSGPTAKLRVRPTGPVTYTWVHTYEKPNCQGPQSMGAIGDPDTLLPAHVPKGMLDSASAPNPNIIEQIIPAKPTTLLFTQHGPHSGTTVRTCKLAVNFVAEPGSEYEIGYGYDATQCFASVDKLRLVDGRVVREPLRDAKKNVGECVPFAF